MKKLLTTGLICALLISAAGCAAKEKPAEPAKPGTTTEEKTTTPAPAPAKYKDGEFTAEGDKWQFGYETATVKIENGKIASVTLKRFDTKGAEVNYDDWQGQTVNKTTYPNLKKFRTDMAAKMVEKQSAEVETIAGATVTTKNWTIAADRALKQAENK